MRKIRLTESDIENIVRMVIEQENQQSTYGQCNGSNQVDSPTVRVNVKTKNNDSTVPDNVRFRIIANFSSTKSSTQVYSEALTELKKLVDSKLKESKINGNYDYNLVKVTKIIGSASNYLNGALKPTVDNNGKPIPPQKLEQPPYADLPGEGNSNYEKNMGYAKSRWNNMLDFIRTKGNTLGFTVDSSLSEPSQVQSWIKDTGGCIDEKRDVNKYKFPGQTVLVEGMMKLIPKPPTEEDLDRMLECADGLRIVVGYFKTANRIAGIDIPKNSKQHSCNYATFDILCNGEVIGVSNMNNSFKQEINGKSQFNFPKASIGKDEEGYRPPKEHGGTVYTVINVPTDKLKSILQRSKNGKITMAIRGNSDSMKRDGKFHGDAPMVCAFVIGKNREKRIVYGPQEPFQAQGDVGPKARFMGSFNPCIEKKVVPA